MGNKFYPPATEKQIDEVEQMLKVKLPNDYRIFLLTTNGFDGFINEFYASFSSVEEIFERTQESCHEFFPWAVFIGTNGNLEMFVMDKREFPYRYGLLPFIAAEDDFIPLGNTFEGFIKRLYDDTAFER